MQFELMLCGHDKSKHSIFMVLVDFVGPLGEQYLHHAV